ncbi:hypothetical protein UFOVP845_25 [uncultured Caudovirales phage]|uniref:Uncharacterized protein n=1 Tax=uncultured Caudovirales phage TaxID=2100421 RepID=A0A6J5PAB5_9CAUD|nr:hypothetical protein UFOVP845_25 [uncultured Caudovirales phage]
MFLYPSAASTEKEIAIPRGSSLSVGSIGDQPTLVQIGVQTPTGVVELLNRAQTFGPYANDRVATIYNRGATVEYDVGTQPKLRSFPALVLGSLTPVTLVQPAATFITLTYETNAGLVRLVSAGAHGLTAAVAVGASVYVTWASGTGVNGFYEITALDADTTGVKITINLPFVSGLGTPTVAVANTVVTLASVTVPGWSMGVGGGMEIDALFTITNSATAKNLGLTYGGGVLMAVSAASNASACAQKLMCNRGSSQVVSNAANQVGHGLSTAANVFLSVDATVDQTFAITAQPAAANNIVKLEAFKLHINF